MEISYVYDSGARHEWICRHGERKYVVSYHYQNDCWTVQLVRSDGEREILRKEETERILEEFPRHRAFDLARRSAWSRRICDHAEGDSNTRDAQATTQNH